MSQLKIAIVGLGYVGLPLAIEFASKYATVGFDINIERIDELNKCIDRTKEIDSMKIERHLDDGSIKFSNVVNSIADANVYIITVPTPTDKNNRPDLNPLISASKLIGSVLKRGDVVVYESTVYPGVTEDICVPELVSSSNLVYNEDFFVGYSPERINPGDKEHTVSKILKVTSGSTPSCADLVDNLYNSIITAGTYKASSIKVAEAAKVIENSQRDINIAFVNELAKIFNLLKIDTNEVLEAAGTKWNFLKFKPGLVGGHCIGVDPYYLAQKAQEVGYHSEIILAGRRLNDGMGKYVASELIKGMVLKDIPVKNANVLILGITFKENCPDVRNTKVIDIVNELLSYNVNISILDPVADAIDVKKEYNFDIVNSSSDLNVKFDSILLAVAHSNFQTLDFLNLKNEKSLIYDIKGFLDSSIVDYRL
jgi:UDP-N-acetyl-D-galactosamine dehydrogenase